MVESEQNQDEHTHDKGQIVVTYRHKLATYHRYSTGLHEILLHNNSRMAVDKIQEYFELMYIYHVKCGDPYFILVDAGQYNDIPLKHIFTTGRALLDRYPNVPGGGRAVYLFERSALVAVFDMFMKLLRSSVSRRYLPPQERESSTQWLLQGIIDHRATRKD